MIMSLIYGLFMEVATLMYWVSQEEPHLWFTASARHGAHQSRARTQRAASSIASKSGVSAHRRRHGSMRGGGPRAPFGALTVGIGGGGAERDEKWIGKKNTEDS